VLERSENADHLIVKAHSADPMTLRLLSVGAAKVVCSFRRPEDAIASRMEAFDLTLKQSIEDMSSWLSMFRSLPASTLFLDFEEIQNHPVRTAIRIAREVCPGFVVTEAARLARKYSKKKLKLPLMR
jgi:hypothetical protein